MAKTDKQKIAELRKQLREAKEDAKHWYDEYNRVDDSLQESVRAWWLLHAMLGFPKFVRTREHFWEPCFRAVARLTGSRIPWRRILQRDSIAVARYVALRDPTVPEDVKQAIRKDERVRCKSVRRREQGASSSVT